VKEAVIIFKRNRNIIENFLRSTIELNDLTTVSENNAKSLFNLLRSLELAYMVDTNFKQTTSYFYKERRDDVTLGMSKGPLFSKIKLNRDTIFISNPYISSHTGNMCITAARPVDGGYLILDFKLLDILKNLSLIELNQPFNATAKFTYGLIGFSLLFMSFILLAYGAKVMWNSFLLGGLLKDIGAIFTPIIAITLALAIFDLARTVLEREVFYKNYSETEDADDKVLSKFLTSIIIALSIESLMVVFKITLSDFSEMTYALYLILGISLLITSLAFYKWIGMKRNTA
jgi:hypothetical protein